jgi:hypothetical protein
MLWEERESVCVCSETVYKHRRRRRRTDLANSVTVKGRSLITVHGNG